MAIEVSGAFKGLEAQNLRRVAVRAAMSLVRGLSRRQATQTVRRAFRPASGRVTTSSPAVTPASIASSGTRATPRSALARWIRSLDRAAGRRRRFVRVAAARPERVLPQAMAFVQQQDRLFHQVPRIDGRLLRERIVRPRHHHDRVLEGRAWSNSLQSQGSARIMQSRAPVDRAAHPSRLISSWISNASAGCASRTPGRMRGSR